MKKFWKYLLLVLLISLPAFVFADTSRTYLVSDQLWQDIDLLCRVTGVIGPSSASPVPEPELIRAYSRIDSKKLDGVFIEIYERAGKSLYGKDYNLTAADFGMEFLAEAGLEAYLYSGDIYRQEFFVSYKDMEKPVKLGFEADYSRYANLFLEYGIGNTITQVDTSAESIRRGYNFVNHTNLDCLFWLGPWGEWSFLGFSDSEGKLTPSIQEFEPERVGGSFGNEHVNFTIARSRQSMGHGVTGNFLLGDNFPYQDMMQLKLMSGVLSYTLSYTHYDTQTGPYDYYDGSSRAFRKFSLNTDEHNIMVIHRFDLKLGERFRLVFNEGGIFCMDNALDPRLLIPGIFVHSYNNKSDETVISGTDEANNIMSFEVEWTPAASWLLTAQVVIDQFRLPGETDGVPDAWGVLLNCFWTKSAYHGYFDSWAEAVYTSPYLYLNEKYNDEDKSDPNYNYDYIVGYWLGKASEIGYAGYTWGPDSIVLNVGSKYTHPELFAFSASFLYRIHGERGINYGYNSNQKDTLNGWVSALTPTGTPEHYVQLKFGGEKYLPHNFTLSAQLAFQVWANYGNDEGETKFSVQSVLGARWTF